MRAFKAYDKDFTPKLFFPHRSFLVDGRGEWRGWYTSDFLCQCLDMMETHLLNERHDDGYPHLWLFWEADGLDEVQKHEAFSYPLRISIGAHQYYIVLSVYAVGYVDKVIKLVQTEIANSALSMKGQARG